MSAVSLSVDEHGIAEIALDRPDRNNAMGGDLLDAFAAAVARVRANAAVRVVIVSGRGKHFCAGADLANSAGALATEGGAEDALRRALRGAYDPFLSILDVEVPTIAAVRGAAIGGGLGLALACDLRIAAEDARLQANFVKLGIHPGMAVSFFLPRLVGAERAAEMLFTGRRVSGTEAAAMGLVLRAVPAEQVEEEARSLALRIAGSAPIAVRLTKASLRGALAAAARAHADEEAAAQARCASTTDVREGVMAWMQKRSPVFHGR
jgi:enoyl-CoA hydratase